MQGCNLSLNIQNVFTITSYKGIDPEVQNISGVPAPRIITSSITFNF
jgi:hypothetical protein